MLQFKVALLTLMWMDSLMVLARPRSSPSYDVETSICSVVTCLLYVCMDGRGLLRVLLVSLPKGPCCLPYVLLITSYMVALEAVDYPTFLVLRILVLRFHEDLFYCGVSFKVHLYAILTTCVTTDPMVDFGLEMVVVTVLVFGLLLACELLLLSPVCVCPCCWKGCCLCLGDCCY